MAGQPIPQIFSYPGAVGSEGEGGGGPKRGRDVKGIEGGGQKACGAIEDGEARLSVKKGLNDIVQSIPIDIAHGISR